MTCMKSAWHDAWNDAWNHRWDFYQVVFLSAFGFVLISGVLAHGPHFMYGRSKFRHVNIIIFINSKWWKYYRHLFSGLGSACTRTDGECNSSQLGIIFGSVKYWAVRGLGFWERPIARTSMIKKNRAENNDGRQVSHGNLHFGGESMVHVLAWGSELTFGSVEYGPVPLPELWENRF